MDDVATLTGTRLGPGTLYAALARLDLRALIEALPAEDRRRPYRLTALGADLLHTHFIAISSFATAALRLLEPT